MPWSRARLLSAVQVLALLVSGFPATSGHADDLAALARREKARRAKLAKPTKVLTEEDGKTAAETGSASVSTTSSDAPPAPEAPSRASAEAAKAGWKARAQALRAAVAVAEQDLEQMQKDLNAYRSDLAPLSATEAQDPLRLQKREARLVEMQKAVEVQREVVAQARKSVSILEDEARRAGVPPGWLR